MKYIYVFITSSQYRTKLLHALNVLESYVKQ
jgi:hypothetical protein